MEDGGLPIIALLLVLVLAGGPDDDTERWWALVAHLTPLHWSSLTTPLYTTVHHCTPLYSLTTIIWFIMVEHHINTWTVCVSSQPNHNQCDCFLAWVISFQFTDSNYNTAASSRANCNKLSDILSLKYVNWTVPIICWVGGIRLGVLLGCSIMLSNSSLTFYQFDEMEIILIVFY